MRASRRLIVLTLASLSFAACARDISIACTPTADAAALAQRESAYDSVDVTVGTATARICYSRPMVRGRVVFGGIVPYDTLWRTGANEPTIIHLPFRASLAGIELEPGSYSLYSVPGQERFTLVVNRSTSQWGITMDQPAAGGGVNRSAYTEEVRRQEVGRAPVDTASVEHTERFTIGVESAGADAAVINLDWERTRVRVPIRALTRN